MAEAMIELASQFSTTPAGRYRSDGRFSGEVFRDDVLVPALDRAGNDTVTVVLDGVAGYGSSFLEEAFGGLARRNPSFARRVNLVARSKVFEKYKMMAERYIREALPSGA